MSSTAEAVVTDTPSESAPPKVAVADANKPSSSGPTLLDKLGGPDKMLIVMDDFYGRVLQDPQLARFFAKTDVVKLKRHSLNIIATAFSPAEESNTTSTNNGAPLIQDIPAYLSKTHRRLFEKEGVTEEHFDLFVGHFGDTMEYAGVEQETQLEAMDKLKTFRVIFEEGAQAAAEKQKRKSQSKVTFESDSNKTPLEKVKYAMSQDPWKTAGVAVTVVGVIAISSMVIRKRRA